MSEKFSY